MKKKILVTASICILLLSLIYLLYFRIILKKPIDDGPAILVYPKPTVTRVQEQSGGSLGGFQKAIEERPEYRIEAKLRTETPIEKEGFKITYDYSQAKFIVILRPNIISSRSNFNAWAKEQSLNDLSNFIIK